MKPQQLNLGHELVIDLFAGGGGASTGIEWGIGRPVDIAVNHDPQAVGMHTANHPDTEHFCESVFAVPPTKVTRNQPVGLLWASPDCTHHSKAKGGKPVSSRRRGLAWVVVKWARRTRPRVIMLENVEEFEDWGPLTAEGKPCPLRKGQIFEQWVSQLQRLGYAIEWRQLRACDYGAPTIRRRLFVIARRDGRPIVWPKPTHGDPNSAAVKRGKLLPWRTAAECIDWTLPCPSIFDRARPLAENTMKRIARGTVRFVLEAKKPFIVTCNHGGDGFRGQDVDDPMRTVTAAHDAHGLCVPSVVGCGGRAGQSRPRAGHMINMKGSERSARSALDPLSTITAGATHAGAVAAFLAPYYGSGSGETGRDPAAPAPTLTTKDRLQLVTVQIDGETYVLADIGMRMLQPRELFRAQGFPDSYVIENDTDGNRFPKYVQVRMCGNSVPPQFAAALVKANFAREARFMESAT